MRATLAGLIVVATVGFVIGTSIERHNARHESAGQLKAEVAAAATGTEMSSSTTAASSGENAATHAAEVGGESPAAHAAESSAAHTTERHQELRPLGVDVEAVPFVALTVLASLGLAAFGWTRPRWLPGLVLIAVAMVAFGALDVREAFHQSDENQSGLVILAAGIAFLHFAACGCAAVMATRRGAGGSDPAADMAA